jgi:TPP-dependent pyruvate/acetoin dehydrogenase alpha subunit
VIAPISMVGSLVPVLTGMALAMKRAAGREEGAAAVGGRATARDDSAASPAGARGTAGARSSGSRVALTWVGDGASRTGEFHEGMSLAAALGVPLIVVLQDNGIALGTPAATHLKAPLDAMPAAYGVRWIACDGNNVVDTYLATREMVRACREGRGPAIIVARTFRMGGHATHDEAEGRAIARPEDLAHWGRRDPIGVYEEWLVRSGRDLAAAMNDDGTIGSETGAAANGASKKPATSRSTARQAQADGDDRATLDANRAVLERIEERAAADIADAEREALASRVLPFEQGAATDGVTT